jgi:hypothetical protein
VLGAPATEGRASEGVNPPNNCALPGHPLCKFRENDVVVDCTVTETRLKGLAAGIVKYSTLDDNVFTTKGTPLVHSVTIMAPKKR